MDFLRTQKWFLNHDDKKELDVEKRTERLRKREEGIIYKLYPTEATNFKTVLKSIKDCHRNLTIIFSQLFHKIINYTPRKLQISR